MRTKTLEIATSVLDVLPNPVLIKNSDLEYVWINEAFAQLFGVKRDHVVGKLDKELFPDRQVSQCNGGDLRVLSNNETDNAVETIFNLNGVARETITRKSKLSISESEVYLVGVMHDITDVTRANEALKVSEAKLQKQAQKLAVMASTDALTGCANRHALMEQASDFAENPFKQAAVLLIDADHFKTINDQYGHSVGDDVLKHIATIINEQLSPSDQLYRYGGEEFVAILDVDNAQSAKKIAEAIRTTVADTPIAIGSSNLSSSISIGLTMKERGLTATIDELLKKADDSLYRAKELGRNRVEVAA